MNPMEFIDIEYWRRDNETAIDLVCIGLLRVRLRKAGYVAFASKYQRIRKHQEGSTSHARPAFMRTRM